MPSQTACSGVQPLWHQSCKLKCVQAPHIDTSHRRQACSHNGDIHGTCPFNDLVKAYNLASVGAQHQTWLVSATIQQLGDTLAGVALVLQCSTSKLLRTLHKHVARNNVHGGRFTKVKTPCKSQLCSLAWQPHTRLGHVARVAQDYAEALDPLLPPHKLLG